MKTGLVIKSVDVISDNDMALINQYTRRTLKNDEVYIFSVVLCDNDVDRDFERFTYESLKSLEKLFVGKTGIFDHQNSSKNQTARIFECRLQAVNGKKTALGDDYYQLECRAYMLRSEKSKDIIADIDAGILKEVSVGCAVKHTLCSVCGNDIHSTACHHTKGVCYENRLCVGELIDVYDAYEFSFVAVPAQKNAGVIKAYGNCKKESNNMKSILKALHNGEEIMLKAQESQQLFGYIKELEEKAHDGQFYKEHLRAEVTKYMCISQPQLSSDIVKNIVLKLDVNELSALKVSFKKQAVNEEEITPQLCHKEREKLSKSDKKNQFTI